tara:strand:+ start:816 stop:1754 length:939 start_codon:yes stop_codon:yes gene_type:complete
MSYVLQANTPPPIIIHLDSRFATQYLETDSNGRAKTTNFIYVMKEPIIVPDHMNLLVSLHTATIPYSFYNVRDGVNDKIYYNMAGVDYVLTLDAGNYSATGLASTLKTDFENNGATATISYSRETLKYTFNITGVASFDFKFSGRTDGANELIGLYDIDKNIPIGVNTLSDKAIDLNDSIHGLYIRQNIATKGTLDNEDGTFSNILARLPITTNAGGIIFFTPASHDHETMVSVPVIQTIGIKLTDDRNRAIDLNGLHWQMSMKISYIHKERLRAPPPRRYEAVFTETPSMREKRLAEEQKSKIKKKTTSKK